MVATLPGMRVGLNCEIAVESADGYGEYKSRIEDFEEDRLMLAMPRARGSYVIPATGDPVQVIVPSPGAGTLFLGGEVLSRVIEPIPMLVVRVLAVGHQQARGYFRVSVVIHPTECAVWDHSGGPNQAFWRPVRATLQDMSGGGIGLISHDELAVGSRLKVRFPLPYGGGECAAIGEVKMARLHGHSRTEGDRRWIVGLQFNEIGRRTRERLIKGVHRYQAEERRLAPDTFYETV